MTDIRTLMRDIIQEIYQTVRRNKLRTLLTGFAVAWGIFMLIVLLGAGNGLIHAFEEGSSSWAKNSVRVSGWFTSKPYGGFREGRHVKLDGRDMESTHRRFAPYMEETGATLTQDNLTLSHGAEYVNLSLRGVYPNFADIELVNVVGGRFINPIDLRDCRKCIVLHRRTAEILFKDAAKAVGSYVTADSVAYRVVGVYADRGDNGSSDAYVPFSTLRTLYNRGTDIDNLLFTTQGLTTLEDNEAFETDLLALLAENHCFAPDDKSAVWIWNRFADYLRSLGAMQVLRIGIWVIGIFTLLSGVVGVSNIMLITVKERTHEFGIRKALGAKPRSILGLVIAESVVITTFFGYIGMVAGIVATEVMTALAGRMTMDVGEGMSAAVFTDPTIDLSIAVEATLTLIIAGTLAGYFPARKASRIRPIEALR